jgi:hypothetical protein
MYDMENIWLFDIHADFACHQLVDLCCSSGNELWLQFCTNATMDYKIVPKPIDRLRLTNYMPVDAKWSICKICTIL